MSEQDKKQEQNIANEPKVAYGNNADVLRSTVVDAVQSIQDVSILESILSFIKKKVDWQEEIPNEGTLAAMREAENDEGLEVVDTSSVDAMIASILK